MATPREKVPGDAPDEAERIVAEYRLKVEPTVVGRLLGRVQSCRENDDNASQAYHANADGLALKAARSKALEAVVCEVYGIDMKAPGYTHVAKMKWSEAEAASTADIPPLVTHQASELDRLVIPPVDFVIPPIVAVGGTILGARPKDGKTFMVIGWAHAVASGGRAMGALGCEQGDVLLILLEDNVARFQRRMRQIAGDGPKPDRLHVAFQENTLRIDTGLLDQIRRWARSVERPRLVVVDTLTAVRPVGLDKRGVFQVEYEIARRLNDLGHELGVAVVTVHHLRKMKSEGDPVEELSGTYGFSAATDTLMGIRKNGAGYEMRGRGRDVEEFEYGLQRGGAGRWTIVGSAEQMRMSAERQRALAALRDGGDWMTPGDLGRETGQNAPAAKRMLDRMVADGDGVERNAGRYRATPDQGEMALAEEPGTEVQDEQGAVF